MSRERHTCREVVDEHRLHLLPPGTRNSKSWSEAQCAGQSVDDLVLGTVHQGGAEDRVSQPRLADHPLGAPLGAKARMSAVLVGGGAADVDELKNAGLLRRSDQRDRAAVVDSLEGEASARIFDRITVELDGIDDRARTDE